MPPTTAPIRLGVSSYSFAASLASGRLGVTDLVDWVADSDADHLEIATAGLGQDLLANPEVLDEIGARAAERGVPIVNLVVAADFRGGPDEVASQVEAITRQLDAAHRLGIPYFRHDVTDWGWRDADQAEYEETFAHIVPICQQIADYAAGLGITTMVENHGFFMQNSERVRRLVRAVNRPNFRTLLDVGNFLCVDESPALAAQLTLPHAAVVHLKDFRIRSADSALGEPGAGWLHTLGGASILGTVVGWGDLPVRRVLGLVAASGFSGPVSIEFEGPEDDLTAVETGLATVRRMWEEL